MQKGFLSKTMVVIMLAMAGMVSLSSCNNDDNPTDYGTEMKPIDTNLCYKTWVLVSVGGTSVTADDYETDVFNNDGTGVQVRLDNTHERFVTKNFTWKAYKNGSRYVMRTFFDGEESAKYYELKDDGILRFRTPGVAYDMMVKSLEDSYVGSKIVGKKWILHTIDKADVTGYTYESYEFNADGTGSHVKYDTAEQPTAPVKFTWEGYAIKNDAGLISITENGQLKFYTCAFLADGSLTIINSSPYFEKNFKIAQ